MLGGGRHHGDVLRQSERLAVLLYHGCDSEVSILPLMRILLDKVVQAARGQ